jgi:hypothetical protein
VDGTGNLSNAVGTFKAPLQDGEFLVNASLNMRNIILEGEIFPDDTRDLDVIYGLRREMLRVFNPKSKGVLEFRGKQINCVVEDITVGYETRERFPKFLVSLLCPYPFFEACGDDLAVFFNSWENGFEFVLEILPEGIEFATRTIEQLKTVTNFGDIPCGIEVIFSSYAPVVSRNF